MTKKQYELINTRTLQDPASTSQPSNPNYQHILNSHPIIQIVQQNKMHNQPQPQHLPPPQSPSSPSSSSSPSSPHPYIFCYDQQQPQTLVMLSQPDKIIAYLLEEMESQFLWFDYVELSTYRQLVIAELENQLKIRIKYFWDCRDLEQYFVDQPKKSFVFIVSQDALDAAEEVGTKFHKRVKGGIIYPFLQTYIPPQSTRSHPKPAQKYKQLFHEAQTLQNLKQFLSFNCRKQFSFQQLPNFVLLSDNIWDSNFQLITMKAMLVQKDNPVTRRKIVGELGRLLGMAADTHSQLENDQEILDEFLHKLQQPLSTEQAIFWYTKQTVIYKYINNLLRCSRHPTQFFYIQPYFKDLVTAIRNMQKQQSTDKQLQQFYCYRGGWATEAEIQKFTKNVGEVVQNLGFLSTSRCWVVAESFVRNVFFQIRVKNMDSQWNYGYALLSTHSDFSFEQQIIFNPLNSFKILEISKRQQNDTEFYFIKLSFGQLYDFPVQEKKKEKVYKSIRKFQQKLTENIECEGNTLSSSQFNMDGCIQYWEKYLAITRTNQSRALSLRNLYCCEANRGEQKRALMFLSKEKEILLELAKEKGFTEVVDYVEKIKNSKTKLSVPYIRAKRIQNEYLFKLYQSKYSVQQKSYVAKYIRNLTNQANSYQNQGKIDRSLEIYQQVLSIVLKTNGYGDYFPGILNNIAINFSLKKNLDKSLQFFEESCRIGKQFYGEDSPYYSSMLNNIANIYQQKKMYQKATSMYKTCLEIKLSTLGQKHPLYMNSLNNLSIAHTHQGKSESALEISLKCNEISTKILGQDHPSHSVIYNGISNIYLSMGLYNKALFYQKKCEKMKLQTVGTNHPSYLLSLSNFAVIYHYKLDMPQAIHYLNKYLEIAYQIFGVNHQYARILCQISILYCAQGNYVVCLRYLRAFQKIIRINPVSTLLIQKSLWNLAMAYKDLYLFQKQRQVLLQIFEIRSKLSKNNLNNPVTKKMLMLRKKCQKNLRNSSQKQKSIRRFCHIDLLL